MYSVCLLDLIGFFRENRIQECYWSVGNLSRAGFEDLPHSRLVSESENAVHYLSSICEWLWMHIDPYSTLPESGDFFLSVFMNMEKSHLQTFIAHKAIDKLTAFC